MDCHIRRRNQLPGTGTDKEADRFINYRNRLKNYPISQCYRTRFITSDTKGDIWIGSATGLLMCKGNFKEPEEIEFQRYCRISGNANSLSNNDVHNIYFTRKGEMYVATFGGGLNKLLSLEGAEARFQAYTMKTGFLRTYCYPSKKTHTAICGALQRKNYASLFLPRIK